MVKIAIIAYVMAMRPIIIHISNDFPDPLAPDKTKAVKNLIDGTPEFHHIVYSLNRVNGWSGVESFPFGEDYTAIAYRALPKGILWEHRLQDVAVWIIADIEKRGIKPDLIQGHKFTVEGLIAKQMAAHFRVPFVCSLQGDTDTKILSIKKGLHAAYQDIADRAAMIFPFAAWPIAEFRRHLTLADHKLCVLPVAPSIDTLTPAPVIDTPRFLSVFHLDSWQRKNVLSVVAAIRKLATRYPDMTLDICGRGSPDTLLTLKTAIAKSGIENKVNFLGPAPNGDLPTLMKNYVALVLPSRRESYGLVYAEALFSGLPILYSKDRGIDGLLPPDKIGYRCDPLSIDDIAAGLEHLWTQQGVLKSSVAELQSSGGLDILRSGPIIKKYREALQKVLAGTA